MLIKFAKNARLLIDYHGISSLNQNSIFYNVYVITRKILKIESLSTQSGKMKNSLSLKIFLSNQLYNNFFSKTVSFTKFLPKCMRVNFRNIHSGSGKRSARQRNQLLFLQLLIALTNWFLSV